MPWPISTLRWRSDHPHQPFQFPAHIGWFEAITIKTQIHWRITYLTAYFPIKKAGDLYKHSSTGMAVRPCCHPESKSPGLHPVPSKSISQTLLLIQHPSSQVPRNRHPRAPFPEHFVINICIRLNMSQGHQAKLVA